MRSTYLAKLGMSGKAAVKKEGDPREIDHDGDETPKPSSSDDSLVTTDEDAFVMNYLHMGGSDDIRVNFLKRLSYNGIWVPRAERPPQHQTVVIFDWDDTLLCTSYLNAKGESCVTPVVAKHLQDVASRGIKLLELAMRFGHTFIVTNAMRGWVEHSASKYIPDILPTIKKIRVVSARGDYEQQYPGQYHEWKIQAFLKVQKELNSQIITNLVSLGDSNIEMDAVHVMGAEFSQALIKTIKFRETPTPEELSKQLELVYQKFEKILLNARSLKISLERKWIPNAPNAGGSTQQTADASGAPRSTGGLTASARGEFGPPGERLPACPE